MQPCDSLTAMHMRTYYAYYEPQQRVPDQGLPLPQQGVPYQVQQVPQLLTVQQQPFSYNLEWALQQYWQQQQSRSPPPLWLPTSWDQPWAASGATTGPAAGTYLIWHGFGPSTQGEHVDSTQGVYVDSFAGSDSEDAPKDVTPKDGKQQRKKQKVQTYWNHGHRKLLGKKNLRTIKKDRRGGISLLYMATAHSVARRRGLTRTHRSPLARSTPQRYQFPSASARSNPNTPNEQRGKSREPRPIPTHPLLNPSHCRTSSS